MKKLESELRSVVLVSMGLVSMSAESVKKKVLRICKKYNITEKEANVLAKDFLKKASTERKKYEKLVKKEYGKLSDKVKKVVKKSKGKKKPVKKKSSKKPAKKKATKTTRKSAKKTTKKSAKKKATKTTKKASKKKSATRKKR